MFYLLTMFLWRRSSTRNIPSTCQTQLFLYSSSRNEELDWDVQELRLVLHHKLLEATHAMEIPRLQVRQKYKHEVKQEK